MMCFAQQMMSRLESEGGERERWGEQVRASCYKNVDGEVIYCIANTQKNKL